jgi:hypothetical protein
VLVDISLLVEVGDAKRLWDIEEGGYLLNLFGAEIDVARGKLHEDVLRNGIGTRR